MAERLNRVVIKNKVIGLIITGGQDNVQSVAGKMLNYFGELGFSTAPFPYVGHSLGWSAERMQENMDYVKSNEPLHTSAFELVERSITLAQKLVVQ